MAVAVRDAVVALDAGSTAPKWIPSQGPRTQKTNLLDFVDEFLYIDALSHQFPSSLTADVETAARLILKMWRSLCADRRLRDPVARHRKDVSLAGHTWRRGVGSD